MRFLFIFFHTKRHAHAFGGRKDDLPTPHTRTRNRSARTVVVFPSSSSRVSPSFFLIRLDFKCFFLNSHRFKMFLIFSLLRLGFRNDNWFRVANVLFIFRRRKDSCIPRKGTTPLYICSKRCDFGVILVVRFK